VTFARRRLRNGAIALLVLAAAGAAVWAQYLALRDPAILTGWMLVAAFAVLASYNVRKKFPFLPLLSSAAWMQTHIYLGLLAAAVFLMHVGVELPNGVFESVLWVLTAALLLTGFVGLAITRLAPPALTHHGERLLFERIPVLRAQLAEEVHDLALRSVETEASTTLADYYHTRLHSFFARPRNLLAHLVASERPRSKLCRELRTLDRYLSEQGRETREAIEDRVLAKDNLDFQVTWQGLLKGWLFLHIPLTYATALVAIVHIGLVYAFQAALQ